MREDLLKICTKSGKPCENLCKLHIPNGKDFKCKQESEEDENLEHHFAEVALASPKVSISLHRNSSWYKVSSIEEIFEIFSMIEGTYMLVGGNTAQGILEDKYPAPPETYIDVNGVATLRSHRFDGDSLVLGANMTLTDTMRLFDAVATLQPAQFKYLSTLRRHMEKVAHIPVRNVGTLAGNLFFKHQYPKFPSDLFTIYETVGAKLIIDSGSGEMLTVSFPEFLATDMYKKIITNIVFPPLDCTYVVRTYKVLRRAQNDHAIVNAGFCFSFDKANIFKVLTKPRIVYGGIAPDFVHASATESLLEGKRLLNTKTLQQALSSLHEEIQPTRTLPEATSEYRQGLALALFYRYVLSLNPLAVNPRFRSGAEDIARPLSRGIQEYYSTPAEYPLTEPIPKIESLIQCSGEIEYANDLRPYKDELYGALVLTDRCRATLAGVNADQALNIPGVVAFFSAKDIPGINSFVSTDTPNIAQKEQLFVDGEILYAGQAVGVIVATSQQLANYAAARVKVTYTNKRKPLLTVQEVLASGETDRVVYQGSIQPTVEKKNIVHTITGDYQYHGQFNYHYETHSTVVRPIENTLDITVATQWIQTVAEAVSELLNMSVNRINVRVLRCGGGFGGKLSRPNIAACAAALSAHLLQRPVRIVMDLEQNMRSAIGRYHMLSKYKVEVDNNGVIQRLKIKYYNDKGASFNDSITAPLTIPSFPNIYDSSTWNVDAYDVLTDKATTTFMRAPGTLGATGLVEHIMEHIAMTVKRDPMSVRLSNAEVGSPISGYVAEVKTRADYNTRLAACRAYNASNQWKKRGISIVPMKFLNQIKGRYHALVSIYSKDGRVAISHGGSELGQGMNTKAAQVAAHELGVPLELVKVKPTNNFVSPNDTFTASSTTTDGICYGIRKCCEELNKRLDLVRSPQLPWSQLIQQAYLKGINLNATFMFDPQCDLVDYYVYGVTVTEVEIDCLTGEHRIPRVDILLNLGKSLNPVVDIGQIEGAFVMGLGHFTCEKLIFDPDTGLLKTDRTWEYKVLGAKDIPEDWRIYFNKDSNTALAATGPYGSKTVAEAPTVMSISVSFAIRRALESVRRDVGLPESFFNNDPPVTTEVIFLRSGVDYEDYSL
ncbi:xanthine dehydrogenase-like [Macrosteles quadrilineatus]|uniref:xanthine dehydrogenase-like n=1 Tax=Macrosteles quadrilineatus TaxID=74068 RepID=UPI0023E2CE7C|nr:xanthine dehydrogenase-like [Macrosteles quadrilineatus]